MEHGKEGPEFLSRETIPTLDAILGKAFPVLDNGFIRVIDYVGGDAAIVQAARVSYGVGTKQVNSDRGLIRYLLRHRHTTPFEMCEIKLHVRVPMDTWRQWIRHRTANVNEYSTRYSVAVDAAQQTEPGQWRLQTLLNRQGSDGNLDIGVGTRLSEREMELQKLARDVYEERLASGVAREQARKDLPLSTYTEAYWKIDLHNLLHFLSLRMEKHAQSEIRAYASIIGKEIVANWVPTTWEAFLDYKLNSVTFSSSELRILRAQMQSGPNAALAVVKELGWLGSQNNEKRSRELEEFTEKTQDKLGINWNWSQPSTSIQ